jgi:hypothetical protein
MYYELITKNNRGINFILLIAVLDVITEQGDEDLKNLQKICRDEYEKFRPRSEHKNSKYDVYISNI